MIVVADTTPLNYLILIDEIDLLPSLYGPILLPYAAFKELQHQRTPPKVREWIDDAPGWLQVRTVATITSPTLLKLDSGEREAIQLALDLAIGTVLIDEAEGRRIAVAHRLKVQGTLGILESGARLGKTDLRSAFSKLEQTSFRLSPVMRAAFLERNL